MKNICISCEKRSTRQGKFLCHVCEVEEKNQEREAVDLRYERLAKTSIREVSQDLPALRIRRERAGI